MAFKDIVGNEQVKKILKLSLSKNRLPNSLLFVGPPGVGKLKLALVLAKALNCEQGQTDSCDHCPSCLQVDRGQHPNVRLIQREKNREQIVKDQIDEINYLSKMRPWSRGKLVFIINEADRMNETVANSLLKTLEEPNSSVYFILVTEDLQMILPTIKSRCQVLKFKPVSPEDIEKALMERGFTEDRATLIAATSDGNLEQALSLKWEEFKVSRDRSWQLFRQLIESSPSVDFLDLISGKGRKDFLEEFKEILSFFSVFLRDLMAIKNKSKGHLLNSDLDKEIERLAPLVKTEKAIRGIWLIEDFLSRLKKNPNLSIMSYELAIFLRE
ncbi:MAG: DNA polymerase III subunit delta' [Candidatus Saccharicenans sp.]|nr:MAG: DNA polymerase III subunit delta' [Candidatus Aminicenantes bacterium]HEK85058.1 DNA polymerase III subunit delta' [Candidatus Aminicenantes bacterium]